MPALEIRIIAYGVLALSLIIGSGWVGYHFTRQHYEIVLEQQQIDAGKALAAAQQTIINTQKERDAALAQEEKDHATLVANDTTARLALDQRVHDLTAALRAHALSCPMAAAARGLGAGASPGSSGAVQPSSSELDKAAAEFNAASDRLIDACQHDAREVTGILKVAPK